MHGVRLTKKTGPFISGDFYTKYFESTYEVYFFYFVVSIYVLPDSIFYISNSETKTTAV